MHADHEDHAGRLRARHLQHARAAAPLRLDVPDFCFLKKMSGVRKLTTFYCAKNDHRWATFIPLKTINSGRKARSATSREPSPRPPAAPTPRSPAFRKCIFRKYIFRKCIFRKFCKFLAGSFSAVSKRNFAIKYAFDSIFQALKDLHPFAPLQSQKFRKKSV